MIDMDNVVVAEAAAPSLALAKLIVHKATSAALTCAIMGALHW